VLTLTGSANVANYQTALESVTFSSTGGNVSNSVTDTSRTVSWQVTDGTLSSNTITSTVDITAVPPVLSGGGNSVNYMPQGTAVAVDAGLDVGDVYTGTLAGATVAHHPIGDVEWVLLLAHQEACPMNRHVAL
jgi:hypothetical protein